MEVRIRTVMNAYFASDKVMCVLNSKVVHIIKPHQFFYFVYNVIILLQVPHHRLVFPAIKFYAVIVHTLFDVPRVPTENFSGCSQAIAFM